MWLNIWVSPTAHFFAGSVLANTLSCEYSALILVGVAVVPVVTPRTGIPSNIPYTYY